MDKRTLRRKHRALREAMSSEDVDKNSRVIAVRLKNAVDWPSVHKVHIYRSEPLWKEVDTVTLVEDLAPLWMNTEVHINDDISLTAEIPTLQFDVIIVPLVAFDTDCNRIGLGGGWYDRFLRGQVNALTVGVAFETQKTTVIHPEEHDQRLSMVITEREVYAPTS
jgi:5-formyltetrahydrofolate cyclo-ligase